MKFTATKISGAYLIEIERREDERGFFGRAWCEHEFAAQGLSTRIAQVNTTISVSAGTLRGMHYQLAPHAEVKVMRCQRGAVYDVIIDLRPESVTYLQWVGTELTAENATMLYAPENCAHGYLALCDDTELSYFTSQFYTPDAARGVRYNDPIFDICWPVEIKIASEQDRSWPDFAK